MDFNGNREEIKEIYKYKTTDVPETRTLNYF